MTQSKSVVAIFKTHTGADIETAHARNIINRANPEALQEHQPACATNEACAVGA